MSRGARRAAVGGVGLLVLIAVGAGAFALAAARKPTPAAQDDESALVTAHRAQAVIALVAETLQPDADGQVDARRVAQATVLRAMAAVAEVAAPERWASVDALLVRSLEVLQRIEQGADSFARTQSLDDLRDAGVDLRAELDAIAQVRATPSRTPVDAAAIPVVLAVLAVVIGTAAIVVIARVSGVKTAGSEPAGRSASNSAAGAASPGPATPPAGGGAIDIGDHPPLEGIASSEEFGAVVQRERERSVRYGHPLAFIDLVVDQADALRSRHGEAELEYVVVSVAELARDNTRSADSVAVLAADRVGVLLPETTADNAEAVADKLCRSVALFPFSDGIHATVTSRCRDLLDESATTAEE